MNEKFEIEYGGLQKTDMLKKLDSAGILLNEFAETIISSDLFKVSKQKQKITLIVATIKDLGLETGATIPEIKIRLKRLGLDECPLEVALYLRLYLKDQEENSTESKNTTPLGSLTVFSKPLTEDDSFPKGLYLRKMNGNLWLRGYRCSLDYVWGPNDQHVFKLI